ncbi:hypothetical protein KXD40_007428 [Peronospora effusa]|nr:hypothetical protein KXD40_007428 [Peronospora effusa]
MELNYMQYSVQNIWKAMRPVNFKQQLASGGVLQLYYVLDQMYKAFKVNITHQQVVNRTFPVIKGLAREDGSHEKLIVENIVNGKITFSTHKNYLRGAKKLEGDVHKPKKLGQIT